MIKNLPSNISTEEKAQLLEAAKSVLSKAYVPYSGFRVGAAILTVQGNIFTGCNVENGSYSLTICAERNAIASAVTQEGGDQMRIRAVAVVNEIGTFCPPCGACRQVLYEFRETAIEQSLPPSTTAIALLQNGDIIQEIPITELLPSAFQLK